MIGNCARYSDCDGINYEGQLRLSRFAREVPADYFLMVAKAGAYCFNKEHERRMRVENRIGWLSAIWLVFALLSFWVGR